MCVFLARLKRRDLSAYHLSSLPEAILAAPDGLAGMDVPDAGHRFAVKEAKIAALHGTLPLSR